MEQISVVGGKRLRGTIKVQGSKNSALPILAATVLCRGKNVIHNCPRLTDVDAAIKILEYLGCKVTREDNTVTVDSETVQRFDIPEKLMHEMRSSIVFLGPLIARMGRAFLSAPGGCEIGLRPIDLHIKAMKRFGVTVNEGFGKIDCTTEKRLQGAEIVLSFPSVGATENIMLAAAVAKGRTVVVNSAREPEIEDLANYLNKCGAKIYGAGSGTIIIDGVDSLNSCEHNVIPDRIMTSTYMACCAVSGGEIELTCVCPKHVSSTMQVFLQSGCEVRQNENTIIIKSQGRLNSFGTVRTMPFPGFPTDFQAPAMTMATVAKGTSVFVENIFESRYKHVCELLRMGADIKLEGRVAIVSGVSNLTGANVVSPDLRGGTALVLAGLCAEGETVIRNLSHIDRGCENFTDNLKNIGADIRRELYSEK